MVASARGRGLGLGGEAPGLKRCAEHYCNICLGLLLLTLAHLCACACNQCAHAEHYFNISHQTLEVFRAAASDPEVTHVLKVCAVSSCVQLCAAVSSCVQLCAAVCSCVRVWVGGWLGR